MLIYKDKISGDELFSDTYPIEEIEGGAVYKVKGKLVTESAGGDNVNIGANASAEEAGEEYSEGSKSGINVVLANRLVPTGFTDKKAYLTIVKSYMKKLKATLEEEGCKDIDVFAKGASSFVKKVTTEFSEYEFYTGEKMDPDGMTVLAKWDGEIPYVFFFKHGILEEKV